MSSQENDADIVVGKDGQEGYMNAEEREVFEEANPDLAAYSSLKFRVDDDESPPPSKEVEALSLTVSTLGGAGKEISRLRSKAEGQELADGVGELLDYVDTVADELDYDDAEELRQQVEVEALQHAAAIEDEELRQRTFAKLEERVDPELYEAFANQWQQAYVEQTERDIQEGLAQTQAEMERQAKTFGAVVQLENDLLSQMSPLEQVLATQLLDASRDDIASMHPGAAQEAVRTRMEMARAQANKIEEAHTQAEIVKAHGKTKHGWSGRDLREADIQMLGLYPELTPTVEEVQAAAARATKGVKIDREKGKRIHHGTGETGMERMQRQTVEISKRLGVPVHDAATGRRIG